MKEIKVREIKELFLECLEKQKTINLNQLSDKEIIKSIRIFQVVDILEREIININGVYGLIVKCIVKI